MFTTFDDSFLKQYRHKQPEWGYGGLGFVIYKRTYARPIYGEDGKLLRTEAWWETIKRCIEGAQKIGAQYTKVEAERLYDHIFNLRCSFSGRSLWQLGVENPNQVSDQLLNCWLTKISSIDDFYFILTESFLGGGVGCNISKEYTYELPRVKNGVKCCFKNTKDADFITPDSREGWCALIRNLLEAYLITGKSFSYSTVCVRSAGEPIKTFGGIAPGPKPLIIGAEEICKILERRSGKKLRTDDVADIICCLGQMIKSGGVRRTAIMLLGDVDDASFLNLKNWDLGNIPSYRSNSNNSLICSNFSHLPEKFWNGYKGNGEPYGLVNLKNCKKYGRMGETRWDGIDMHDDSIIGVNPCQPACAPILTPNGLSSIGEVNVGDHIWSQEGWTTITRKISSGVQPIKKYITSAGFFLGTPQHKIVSNGQKIEVERSDSIDALGGYFNPGDISIDSQDVMDGLVIGDGSVHAASNYLVHLHIGRDDYDYFSSEISSLIGRYRPGINDTAYEIKTTIRDSELPKIYERTVPCRFFSSPAIIIGFLRGLYSANGSICGNRVTLKTASNSLRENVQLMLSSIGIASYFTTNRPSVVKFTNGTYLCRKSYDVNISGHREKFYSLIGFIQKYKMEKLETIIKKIKISRGETNFEIRETIDYGEAEVFDITVDNQSHTYWTGGMNVSNCSEATIPDKGNCNLAEIFLNNITSKDEFLDCAKLLYKSQKAIAMGKFLFKETETASHTQPKLGLGITGICQKLDKVEDWCDYVYNELRKFDKEYSKSRGWPYASRLTVTKPSGTLSLLGNASPGVNPGFARHFIRRVRFSSSDPLIRILREHGFALEPEVQLDGSLNHDILIAEFPCCFNDKTKLVKDMGAINQLELVKKIQKVWADQSVSVTVMYKPDEMDAIKAWLKENYQHLKAVSFLLHKDHNFKQAPYEEITEEKYHELIKNIKQFKRDDIMVGNGEFADSLECAGGACPIK